MGKNLTPLFVRNLARRTLTGSAYKEFCKRAREVTKWRKEEERKAFQRNVTQGGAPTRGGPLAAMYRRFDADVAVLRTLHGAKLAVLYGQIVAEGGRKPGLEPEQESMENDR